ncbi:hypothetical protein G9A89_006467 [Geosiphon pyriformis]|nr:hypothetical protein G9A89_006467 [Geosiphon pyriformis]
MSLDYVINDAFSGMMNEIGMEELSLVVNNLPNNKAAGLLEIPNKLWKHCGEEVLTFNTAHKILSKILSDQISLACNKFNVLCGDNFLVLKGTSIQSSIFAIGSVVENALKKNRELWLVLQNMCKVYNLNWVNRVMTDFGLLDGYREVFSLLLWRIFYNSLLCEIKRHEHLCGYKIDSRFVAKSGKIEASREKTSFLAVGAFVDDTIWVGSSHASMQYILNITSEFFVVNDISINNDKTVAISINQGIKNVLLLINGSLILIAKKGESHQYLGIFLLTKSLSKPSLA